MRTIATTCAIVALCVALLGATPAKAAVVTFQTSFEYSGATAPEGAAPWLTAVYDDYDSSGAVTVTLTASSLVGTEFVSGLYLNVDPGIDPAELVFSPLTKTGVFETPTINVGTNQFKADGGGYFDIMLDFATANGVNNRFTQGDAVSFTMSGVPTLTVASFDVMADSQGKPGIHMAAHVQGIGPNGQLSGWVSAPEPVSLALLGLGCVMGLRRRVR